MSWWPGREGRPDRSPTTRGWTGGSPASSAPSRRSRRAESQAWPLRGREERRLGGGGGSARWSVRTVGCDENTVIVTVFSSHPRARAPTPPYRSRRFRNAETIGPDGASRACSARITCSRVPRRAGGPRRRRRSARPAGATALRRAAASAARRPARGPRRRRRRRRRDRHRAPLRQGGVLDRRADRATADRRCRPRRPRTSPSPGSEERVVVALQCRDVRGDPSPARNTMTSATVTPSRRSVTALWATAPGAAEPSSQPSTIAHRPPETLLVTSCQTP